MAKARVRVNNAHNWKNMRRVDGTFKISKRGKYGARGRWIKHPSFKDGRHFFSSNAEAMRWEQLDEMQRKGTIADLEIQVPFVCVVNGYPVCTYVADFRYRIKPRQLGSRVLVEEVKGVETPEYKLKRKLIHALNLVEIHELAVPQRGTVERFRFLTADQFGPLPPPGRKVRKDKGIPRPKRKAAKEKIP